MGPRKLSIIAGVGEGGGGGGGSSVPVSATTATTTAIKTNKETKKIGHWFYIN